MCDMLGVMWYFMLLAFFGVLPLKYSAPIAGRYVLARQCSESFFVCIRVCQRRCSFSVVGIVCGSRCIEGD